MDSKQPLKSVKSLVPSGGRIPEQATRLAVPLVLLIVLFVFARNTFVPADFGQAGHFRASAIDQNVAHEIKYAGHEECAKCHESVVNAKKKGFHRNVACEVCHGAATEHAASPESVKPKAPRGRGFCPLCHEYLPSRPTGFPQILAASHNPMRPCITCHQPHDPKPPQTPKECSACHAEIATTKSLSHHVYVACTVCHQVPTEHKTQPRRALPSKPATREFCGGCHEESVASAQGITGIDLATHGERYVCWQCHYPHLPEVE